MKPIRLKQLWLIFAIALTMAFAACGDVPTQTFNDKAAITMRSVTAARDTSTALLQAGKITLAQDAENQKKLDAIVEGVKTARAQNDAAKVEALKVQADGVVK